METRSVPLVLLLFVIGPVISLALSIPIQAAQSSPGEPRQQACNFPNAQGSLLGPPYQGGSVWTSRQVYSVGDPVWIYWAYTYSVSGYLSFQGPYTQQVSIDSSQMSSGQYFAGYAQPQDVGYWTVSLYTIGGYCCALYPPPPGGCCVTHTAQYGSTNFQVEAASYQPPTTYQPPPPTTYQPPPPPPTTYQPPPPATYQPPPPTTYVNPPVSTYGPAVSNYFPPQPSPLSPTVLASRIAIDAVGSLATQILATSLFRSILAKIITPGGFFIPTLIGSALGSFVDAYLQQQHASFAVRVAASILISGVASALVALALAPAAVVSWPIFLAGAAVYVISTLLSTAMLQQS